MRKPFKNTIKRKRNNCNQILRRKIPYPEHGTEFFAVPHWEINSENLQDAEKGFRLVVRPTHAGGRQDNKPVLIVAQILDGWCR